MQRDQWGRYTLPMNNTDFPFLSIIIPTYNRPGPLATCMQALARLDYPHDRFEIIIVDDGGDSLCDTAAVSTGKKPSVKVIRQPHAGPAAARNTGAASARGEFLAFTDDDCAPASDWLTALVARFTTAPAYAVGGRTLNALHRNPYATASQLLSDFIYAYYNSDADQARFFASNNFAFPANDFRAVGGFDETYLRTAAEDRDLCDRWLSQGRRMIYAPEAVVYHAHALTFGSFWRQHFGYGRGAFNFHCSRARRERAPIKIEPPSFYLNLLRSPFVQGHGRQALLLAGLLVVAQSANAAGFFWEKGTKSIHE